MSPRPWYLDMRDWLLNSPTAQVYAWVFSQPPEIVIGYLRERPELWRAVCEQIGSDKYCTVETLPLPDCFATMGTWDGGGDLAEKHNAYIKQRIADEVAATVEACAVVVEQMARAIYLGPDHWKDWELLDDAAAAIRTRGEGTDE